MKTHLGQVLSFVGMLAVVPAYAADAPPAPAPEMQKLKWMVGSWSVNETHEKSEWSPGGKGKGTSVFTLGPGGHSLHYDYKSSGPMGPFAGKGLTAWDSAARVYRAAWTDNVTPGILISECREEGKDLVCVSQTEMNGQKVTFRSRSVDPKPSGWTEVMETSADGTTFQKMLTLEYRPKR
jgi:hypothetical protein